MRQLKFMFTCGVEIPAHSTVKMEDVMPLLEQARQNKLMVVETALTVESQLNSIIAHYFFGENHLKQKIFDELVLNSDWCSFAARRKLVNHIINEFSYFEGSAKNDFDASLRKTISYRNAFTHGELSSDGKRVWLSFFEGTPRKEELTDQFLEKVETVLIETFHTVHKLAQKIGAIKGTGSENFQS